MFRSTSLRLAALYTAGFALSVVVLGAITLLTTHAALKQQFDRRVHAESQALAEEFRTEGPHDMIQAVRERDRTRGALDYGLVGPQGQPIAGRLSAQRLPVGWSALRMRWHDGELVRVRVLTTDLPDGSRLSVGDDEKGTAALERTILEGFGWAFAGVVALGIFGAYCFSRAVHRRLADMTAAANAIIQGDLSRRIPAQGTQDDLDRLAGVFNRTLDRISSLMDSLRQVSNDIAHDLRTPLTRLRQRLEAIRSLRSPVEREEAVEGALHDVDAILETFSALLRIAQIEGGARRAAFRPVDLSALARNVVDAFAPSAEDAGQGLRFAGPASVFVDGDGELLTQMLVNLVENALRHAGPSAQVLVTTEEASGRVTVAVVDDGPGVPDEERERLFDRFYRLEHSRSTPGSGLGLALVAAIARLHDGMVSLSDARPGLRVEASFAAKPASGTLAFPNVAVRSATPPQN
jgi:signal transduction histidine kinase